MRSTLLLPALAAGLALVPAPSRAAVVVSAVTGEALGDGTTLELERIFDWSEANAMADWVAADYMAFLPGGLADATVTAASLGSAVVQDPGELPDVYWEGFLGGWGDTYQGWTFSDLDVRTRRSTVSSPSG